MRGALFETWVIGEMVKSRFNRGLPGNLYFWRDRKGDEVDILVEVGKYLIPVEIKSGKTFSYRAGVTALSVKVERFQCQIWVNSFQIF